MAGTCCRGEEDLDWLYRLKAGQTTARDNHLTYALNDREQQVITLAQETRLLDRGGAMSSVCAVCWPGEMHVRMVAAQGRTVALAVALDSLESETCPDEAVVPCRAEAGAFVPGPTDLAPYHALAVYERRNLEQEQPARFLPSPCQGDEVIQGLEVHEDRRARFVPEVEKEDPEAPPVYFMRVFCETMWFDLPFDGGQPIAQLYSDIEGIDGPVNLEWLGPARHDDDGAVFLTRGQRDDGGIQMDLWRSRNPTDGAPVSVSIVQKPEWLTAMSDADTALPFHLPAEGAVPARVVTTPNSAAPAPEPMDGEMATPAPAEATHIERYEPALGWTRAPTTRWPIESEITPDGTMAVSAAHLVEPTADNLGDQRVGIFVHDLRTDASGWGRQVDPSGVIKFNGYHGISFFARSGDPNFAILGTGEVGANGRVSYTPLEIGCTPPR